MFTIMFFMTIEVNEQVRVEAVFSRGQLRPVWFDWNGRQVRIRETAFSWKTQEGYTSFLHFSVTDGLGLYELCYNMITLNWEIRHAAD